MGLKLKPNELIVFFCLFAFFFDNLTLHNTYLWGLPGGSALKSLPANAGDSGSIPRTERSSGEGNGNPLHYSSLRNPMDRGAWQATVHRVTRIGHNLVTKPSPAPQFYAYFLLFIQGTC